MLSSAPPDSSLAWLKKPDAVAHSNGHVVMNFAGQGHVDLFSVFTADLGFARVDRGLAKAKELFQLGHSLSYLTLTNDHQPKTQRDHDNTLAWDRSLGSSVASSVRFIGQPGRFVEDGIRKEQFCRWSEQLALEAGDKSLRFGVPCAITAPDEAHGGRVYSALLREQQAASNASELFWLMRALRKRGVVAHGGGIKPIASHREMLSDKRLSPEALHHKSLLLLRFLHPTLLQHAHHLNTAVRVRFEIRVFGLVQWGPLRVWVSRHGFSRGGSPWWNYTADEGFHASNRRMWDTLLGPNPQCDADLPEHRPPFISEERFAQCRPRKEGKGSAAQPAGCCLCLSVSDVVDEAHSEAGFATGGTLLRLEHVARAAGLSPQRLRVSIDGAITRYLVMQQREFLVEANGSSISRWQTPFSVDIAFGPEGDAVIYDTHLVPTWKKARHWPHPAIDRGNNLAVYSTFLLAMSDVLLDTEALDRSHQRLLSRATLQLDPAAGITMQLLREFLRDQRLAPFLGFRRAWPSTSLAVTAGGYASVADLAFTRLLDSAGLLDQELDVTSPTQRDASLLHDLFDRDPPLWAWDGKLWRGANQSSTVCDDAQRVLDSWS